MERAVVTASDTLQARLDAGERFDQASLLVLLRQVAAELAAAHERGQVHGAIRPADIHFDTEGAAALTGFGRDITPDPMTASCYAPIEAYAPVHPLGPWSDIYSLGAVLWHAATGKPPADALHRKGDVTLTSLVPEGFDPEFLRAIDAALEIAPQRRPQTVGQWLGMFSAAPKEAAETEAAERPASARIGLSRLYLVSAVALAAGSWAAVVLLSPERKSAQQPVAAVRSVAPTAPAPRQAAPVAPDILDAQRRVAAQAAESDRLLQEAEQAASELDRLRPSRSIEVQWREGVETQKQLLEARSALAQVAQQLERASNAEEATQLARAAESARTAMEVQRTRILALVAQARNAPLRQPTVPKVEPKRPEPKPTLAPVQVAQRAPQPQRPIVEDAAPVDGGQPPMQLIRRADRTLRDVFDEYEDLRRLVRRSYREEDLAYGAKRRAYRDTMAIYDDLIAIREVRNRLVKTGNIRAANQRYSQLETAAARLRARMAAVRNSI